MKCNNCPALRTEGFEYPESYCAAGVPEDGKMVTDDGCRYTMRRIAARIDRRDRQAARQYDGVAEYYQEEQEKEHAMRVAIKKGMEESRWHDIVLARKSDTDGGLFEATENILNDEMPAYVMWAYQDAEREIQKGYCARCEYGVRKRPQKCATCRRNRYMKDNFKEDDHERRPENE